MKLADWARKHGIGYRTAWNWYKSGKLPCKSIKTPSGSILVEEDQPSPAQSQIKEVSIYCRVSTYEQKDNLLRQKERCSQFALQNGWSIKEIITEVASGLNDHRPKLTKLLKSKPHYILIEHKDRLTRFGFNYFDILLPQLDCQLIVMNQEEESQHDLRADFAAIMTSFCCRLYGMRRGLSKSKILKQSLTQD